MPAAVPPNGEPEMAAELLGNPWSNVAIPATPLEVSHPRRAHPKGRRWSIPYGVSSLAGRTLQCQP